MEDSAYAELHVAEPVTSSVPAEHVPHALSSRTRARRVSGRVFWLPPALAAVVMTVLGIWGIDRNSMFGTEDATYWAAHLSFPALWRLLSHVDAVHGLYYMMMHGVFLLGDGEVVLRIPSVIGMVAAAAMVALIANKLTRSSTLGVLAGLVFALMPVVDDYAQIGRSYAIDVALVLVASYVLIRIVDTRSSRQPARWRDWICYAAVVTLAGYMNEMTSLMLLAHGLTLLWSRVGAAQVRRWLAACAGALIVMTPLILVSHAEDSALAWISIHFWEDLVDLWVNLLGPGFLSVSLMTALIVLALLPRRHVPRERDDAGPRGVTLVTFALPLLVVPGLVLLIESSIALPLYGGVRYVLYSSAGAALLAAAGIQRLARLFARPSAYSAVVSGAAVLAVLAVGLPQQASSRTASGQPQDMNGASSFVAAHARAGDAILYIPAAAALAPLGYPDDFVKVRNIAEAESPGASGRFYGVPEPTSLIVARMMSYRRIWEVGPLSAGGISPRLSAERAVLKAQFHVSLERTYAGMDDLLWVRDTSR
jgi:mannosyltransferase